MKSFKNYSKLIGLFFSILILFQGCTVYKSTTIQQAVQTESKVKVRTKNGETFKFSRVGTKDGNYYGVSKTKGETIKISLDENFINTIKEKDKTLSTILTIGIPITIVVLIISSISGSNIGRGLSGK